MDLITIWWALLGGVFILLVLLAILQLLRVFGILPIELFKRRWYNEYLNYKKYYEDKCKELEKFQSDIYEKEIIKQGIEKIRQLQTNESVLKAKVEILSSTNDTLTKAIQNRN